MIKSLKRHGNSFALVIEKPILELLGADTETDFDVTTDGQALVLTPLIDAKRHSRFKSALSRVNKRYPKALKKLAE